MHANRSIESGRLHSTPCMPIESERLYWTPCMPIESGGLTLLDSMHAHRVWETLLDSMRDSITVSLSGVDHDQCWPLPNCECVSLTCNSYYYNHVARKLFPCIIVTVFDKRDHFAHNVNCCYWLVKFTCPIKECTTSTDDNFGTE